jgi:type IX secretion system PorP/SprF family membrane protein
MKVTMRFIITVTLLMASIRVSAQDPTFTQFYANPLYLNPAFAGSFGCPRFAMNYRNQWPSLSGNYVTYSASYDQYVKSISGGLGVLMTHDQQAQGTFNTSMLGLIYSYHLKINRKWKMMFGARASWYQKFLDWNKLTFNDMIDPKKGFIYATGDVPRGGSRGFFDASAGMLIFNKRFFAGAAVHHINEPNETLIIGNSKLPMRITAHAGAEIPFGNKSKYSNPTALMPNIIYQYQNGFEELNIGTYLKYNEFTAGVWYRTSDAFIVTLGMTTPKFKFGYSYDVTVSELNNGNSGGSHELSLGIYINCHSKPTSFKTISCPSF